MTDEEREMWEMEAHRRLGESTNPWWNAPHYQMDEVKLKAALEALHWECKPQPGDEGASTSEEWVWEVVPEEGLEWRCAVPQTLDRREARRIISAQLQECGDILMAKWEARYGKGE